jgi:hypothetical protein
VNGEADWLSEAACRGMDVNIWFPIQGGDVTRPKSICAKCPVQSPCRDRGLRYTDSGIWGGLTERGRKWERARLGIKAEPAGLPPTWSWSRATCGSHAGYQRHRREGTLPCNLCKRAKADRVAEGKARKRQSA